MILILIIATEKSNNNETNKPIVTLGNPLASDGKIGRSLNIWDLQLFDNKIYLGGGSTVENTGPINVWAYNPSTQIFENEYVVREEAIEKFRVFDNELYIPAADPQTGNFNKFYRKKIGKNWNLYGSDSVPLAHVRDLIKTNKGKIYAPSSILRDFFNLPGIVAVYNPKIQKFELDKNITNDEFIPANEIGENRGKYGLNIIYRIWNPVEFKSFLVYPVRSHSINPDTYQEAYMNSLGFYVKEDMGKTPRAVQFPDGSSVGEDVLVLNDELYALANQKISPTKFIIYVYKTDFPARDHNWKEILHFQSTNKARSFEYLDGKFYFGLGQDYGDPISKSGDILSYCLQQTNCD